MNATLDLSLHPCFNEDVKGRCGRIHLPVAPKCNIKCNYCNRKFDCVNESRPGVTSGVLSPEQALRYLERVLAKEPRITVVGIAGPGDPFANPEETLGTLCLIRQNHPQMLLCVASNGFGILPYVDGLAETGVSHVTITVNAVDPAVGQHVFAWARDGKVVFRGLRAAETLIERQIEAIKALKASRITVKVNFIVIPGVNEHHVEEVARTMAGLGVDLLNCMAMVPNTDTHFAHIPEPSEALISAIREKAERYLPQMKHCTRCRADAVGLLGFDQSSKFRTCLFESSAQPGADERPYVAVATFEGLLVNQHLGEAFRLQIWGEDGDGFKLIEERLTPEPGTGLKRWIELTKILKDCRAVLVNGIGENPRATLSRAGILPVEMSGFIEMGLERIYRGGNLNALKVRQGNCSKGIACKGDGTGCG